MLAGVREQADVLIGHQMMYLINCTDGKAGTGPTAKNGPAEEAQPFSQGLPRGRYMEEAISRYLRRNEKVSGSWLRSNSELPPSNQGTCK